MSSIFGRPSMRAASIFLIESNVSAFCAIASGLFSSRNLWSASRLLLGFGLDGYVILALVESEVFFFPDEAVRHVLRLCFRRALSTLLRRVQGGDVDHMAFREEVQVHTQEVGLPVEERQRRLLINH